MPDGALVKAFDPGMLTEARQVWQAAGRAPGQLFTLYRHFDFIYPFDRPYPYLEHKAIWRANFRRFVDRTYLEQHAPNVSGVESLNEHTDSRMVTDAALLGPHLLTEQAAVAVWNDEYRGRTVRTADGGVGVIPDDCRLVIVNSPVGNDVPREFYKLAVESDSILGVHPYTRWDNKRRDPGDWRYHSGRWHFNEQDYGLRPRYAFTECGPYAGAAEGWRHPAVLDADPALLVEAMRLWLRDVAGTPAYREGRIIGPGAWFTSGHVGWEWYQLEAGELLALARLAAEVWRPGVPAPQEDDDMNSEQRAVVEETAKAMRDAAVLLADGAANLETLLAPAPWWNRPAPYNFTAQPKTGLKLYRVDRVTVGATVNYTGWAINVSAVDPAGWLQVAGSSTPIQSDDLWLRAADVTPT